MRPAVRGLLNTTMKLSGVSKLDIKGCRQATPYSKQEYLLRIIWTLFLPLFRFSPRPWFKWRNYLLSLFGAKIGKGVHIYSSAYIYIPWMLDIRDDSSIGEWALIYNLGKITIGERVTISHGAHLCSGTHSYQDKKLPLVRNSILINAEAWICTQAFVGPGVNIGQGSVIGARSVICKDVRPWSVMAGNPAVFIKDRIMND